MQHLLKNNPRLSFSVSATTRSKRANEVDGADYYFMSTAEFKKKIDNNEFVEWEEVYPGGYYGTLKAEVENLVARGRIVLFDMDVEGGLNIKKIYGENVLAVFVQPPTVKHLHNRLLARASETAESLAKRIAKAELELTYAGKFDKVIINDNLETALWHAQKMLDDFIKKGDESEGYKKISNPEL